MKVHLNKLFTVFVIIYLPMATVAQTKLAAQRDEIVRSISESNKIYGQAFILNKPALFISRYSDDPCIMPANALTLCGKDAANTFFKQAYVDLAIRNVVLTTQEVFGEGEYVTEKGVFELFDSDNNRIDKGKYLVLWKHTAIGWKMFRDSFGSDQKK